MTNKAQIKFDAAVKIVVRGIGGQRRVLLALGYVPDPQRKGFWLPSNGNRMICFKQKDAISRAFDGIEWYDRAKMNDKLRPKP